MTFDHSVVVFVICSIFQASNGSDSTNKKNTGWLLWVADQQTGQKKAVEAFSARVMCHVGPRYHGRWTLTSIDRSFESGDPEAIGDCVECFVVQDGPYTIYHISYIIYHITYNI